MSEHEEVRLEAKGQGMSNPDQQQVEEALTKLRAYLDQGGR